MNNRMDDSLFYGPSVLLKWRRRKQIICADFASPVCVGPYFPTFKVRTHRINFPTWIGRVCGQVIFRSVDLGRDGDGDPTRRVGGVSIWTATHTKIPVDQSEAENLFD